MGLTDNDIAQLRQKDRYLEVINRFAIHLMDCQTVDEIVWSVAKNAIAELGYEDCVIYLYDEEREFLIQRAAHGPKNPIALDILNPIKLKTGEGIVGYVAKTGKGEIINDTREDKRYVLDDDMRLSEIAVPILHDGKVIGIIDSEHPDANFYPEEDLEILATIASMTASKLMQAKYYEELNAHKEELEHKVLLRTRELKKTLEEVERQKNLISIRNQELMDSLSYAQQIQRSILPSANQMGEMFKEFFVFYKPKDLVSGDFYWAKQYGDHVYFAVSDCTGHGVPGALLSLIGYNALNRAILSDLRSPSTILETVREQIVKTLNTREDSRMYDGMDIGLCVFDKSNRTLSFAGAHQNLIVIRENEIVEVKGTRQSIGYYENYLAIDDHEIDVNEHCMYFLSTDGFKDQFGGEKHKKFKRGPFLDLLKKLVNIDPEGREKEMGACLTEWKGEIEQIDDICVLGVKL